MPACCFLSLFSLSQHDETQLLSNCCRTYSLGESFLLTHSLLYSCFVCIQSNPILFIFQSNPIQSDKNKQKQLYKNQAKQWYVGDGSLGMWEGELDEVRLFPRALSHQEILEHMYRSLREDEVKDMTFYFDFDSVDQLNAVDRLGKFSVPLGKPNVYTGTLASVTPVTTLRQMPVYVASSAPLVAHSRIVEAVHSTSTTPADVVLGLKDFVAQNRSVDTIPVSSVSKVVVTALPDSLAATYTVSGAPPTTVTSANLPIVLTGTTTLTVSVPPATIDGTADLKFYVELSVPATITLPPSALTLMVKVNAVPQAGDAGGMLFCKSGQWAFSEKFTWNATTMNGRFGIGRMFFVFFPVLLLVFSGSFTYFFPVVL